MRDGIRVTVHYKDLAGASYESSRKLDPFLYKDTGLVKRKGMADLVRAVKNLDARDEKENTPGAAR